MRFVFAAAWICTAKNWNRFRRSRFDLLNCLSTPSGYVSAPGWAALGNEISGATSGKVNHLTGFATTSETIYTIAVCGKQFMELVGSTWTSRQDTNFGMGDNDHADTTWRLGATERIYVAVPLSGAANVLRQWAGTGNIASVAGTPRNARNIELFGNRLVIAPTWNASAVLEAYDVYRSADGADDTWPAEFTRFAQSPDPIFKILRLGNILIVYKQYSIGALFVSGGEDADIRPFEPDQVPGHVGLALPEAVVAGGRGHFFLGNENVYLLTGLAEPQPIGTPILPALHDTFAAGSFALCGYDQRSPQRESYWILTNVAHAANLIGPNSTATTYTYWRWDWHTQSWSRGELTTIPRATGFYYSRFGFLDAAPISLTPMLIGLESGAGGANSTVYAIDYSQANRVGSAFTREILTRPFYISDVFTNDFIAEAAIVAKRASSGSATLTWYVGRNVGELLGAGTGQSKAMAYNLNGSTGLRSVNLTGRIHQVRITATNDFDISGFVFRTGVRA